MKSQLESGRLGGSVSGTNLGVRLLTGGRTGEGGQWYVPELVGTLLLCVRRGDDVRLGGGNGYNDGGGTGDVDGVVDVGFRDGLALCWDTTIAAASGWRKFRRCSAFSMCCVKHLKKIRLRNISKCLKFRNFSS